MRSEGTVARSLSTKLEREMLQIRVRGNDWLKGLSIE